MNEERPCTGDYACSENRVPMQMYCDLEQQNTKLKAQIDEVKEYCNINIDDKLDVYSSEKLRKVLYNII